MEADTVRGWIGTGTGLVGVLLVVVVVLLLGMPVLVEGRRGSITVSLLASLAVVAVVVDR